MPTPTLSGVYQVNFNDHIIWRSATGIKHKADAGILSGAGHYQ
jgi:hypothetical protein